MIKKSVFEDELIAGMQRELQPFKKKAAMNDLVKAAEYLHAAVEIFEEAGMTAKADQVLRILAKIASAEEEKEDAAPADDNEVAGKKKDFYENVLKWIENPETPVEQEEAPVPEVIEFKSLVEPKQLSPGGEDLVFKSIAQELGLVDDNDSKPRKPKDPTKVHSPTSEQMVENLKNNGTVFNMADDGFADDLLDLDIVEEPLEVMEPNSGKTFED